MQNPGCKLILRHVRRNWHICWTTFGGVLGLFGSNIGDFRTHLPWQYITYLQILAFRTSYSWYLYCPYGYTFLSSHLPITLTSLTLLLCISTARTSVISTNTNLLLAQSLQCIYVKLVHQKGHLKHNAASVGISPKDVTVGKFICFWTGSCSWLCRLLLCANCPPIELSSNIGNNPVTFSHSCAQCAYYDY